VTHEDSKEWIGNKKKDRVKEISPTTEGELSRTIPHEGRKKKGRHEETADHDGEGQSKKEKREAFRIALLKKKGVHCLLEGGGEKWAEEDSAKLGKRKRERDHCP